MTTNTSSHAQDEISTNGYDCLPAPLSERSRQIAGAATGAAIGLTMGLFGGPVGTVLGAVIGAAVGVLSERAGYRAVLVAERVDAELDAEIGVSGGDIGAPSLRDPSRAFGRRPSEAEFFAESGGLSAPIEEQEERIAA